MTELGTAQAATPAPTTTTGLDAPPIAPSPPTAHDTFGPATQSIRLATWALFVGLGALLAGGGLFATLIGVRGEREGFATLSIGVISAAYYLGFVVGSRLTLRALGSVGHIRVYTALSATIGITALVAGMAVHPVAWTVLRLITGASIAGLFVVSESWLNHIVTNANRGRVLSMYSQVTVVAYGVGQVMLAWVDPMVLTGFAVCAVLVAAAIIPVSLSAAAAPPVTAMPDRMALTELLRVAPTGAVSSLLVGVTQGALLGLAAIYASRIGVAPAWIGVFVASPALGGLLLQHPIASASDVIDRRLIGAASALVAAGAAAWLLFAPADGLQPYLAMALLGGTSFPLYSIAGAYTNDWIPTRQLTSAAAQLVVLFGIGAFIGPLVASTAMARFGTDAFPITLVVLHVGLAVFLLVRVQMYRSPVMAKPWNAVRLSRVFMVPATIVGAGRRLRPSRRRRRPHHDDH